MFLMFLSVIFECDVFVSKIYKTDKVSVVIVGGANVDILLVFKPFVKCTYSSQRHLFQNSFDMSTQNIEFLRCRRVDLAYENKHN